MNDLVPMPNVRRRQEVLEILKAISRGEMSTENGFHRLRSVVEEYLPSGACEGHGELIGSLIFSVLILNKPGSLDEEGASIWQRLQDAPASPLAAARGVLQISIEFGVAMLDFDVERGAQRLYTEYLTTIYHPSTYLSDPIAESVRSKRPNENDFEL
jgi:hypothetical protein